jgi:hypothetical protein
LNEVDFFRAVSRSLSIPPCFSFRPDGVLVPVEEIPDFFSPSAFSALAFFSSSIRRLSSSESVYEMISSHASVALGWLTDDP